MRRRANIVADAVRSLAVYTRGLVGRGISAQGFYAQHLRFRDLVFDIGANTGEHTAAMLKRGARVVALEPQASLAQKLECDFPRARVVPLAVSDRPGQAMLITSSTHRDLATLNPASLEDPLFSDVLWDGREGARVTTLDDLIREFGVPAFVKIDAEGLEDRVLTGLSEPVAQFLFEVRAGLPEVAARAFERLAALGLYEYQVMRSESWIFDPPASASAILADLPAWGDVYARRMRLNTTRM
jgi:FkbM family methyltransferase